MGSCANLEHPMIALTSEQRKSVEQSFRDLASQWTEMAAYRSNIGGLRHHPVYMDLLALGEPAVPLILGELERNWTHAVRQLLDGWWTSKLGQGADIIHRSPQALAGKAYGQV